MERNTKTGEKRARADTGDDFTEDTQLFKTPKVVLNSCDVNFNKCDEHVGLTASKDIPRRHDSCNEPTCCKECGLHFPNLCKGSLHTVFKSLYGPIIIQSFGIYSQYRDDEHELFGPPKALTWEYNLLNITMECSGQSVWLILTPDLNGITLDGTPEPFTAETIKGTPCYTTIAKVIKYLQQDEYQINVVYPVCFSSLGGYCGQIMELSRLLASGEVTVSDGQLEYSLPSEDSDEN